MDTHSLGDWRYVAEDVSLKLLGIGRIGPVDGEQQIAQPKYIQPHEQERIHRLGRTPIDLLLSHDSARHTVTRGYGMVEIRDVLDSYRPLYHFYGHTEEPCSSKKRETTHATAKHFVRAMLLCGSTTARLPARW